MNRRRFLCSTGSTALGALLPRVSFAASLQETKAETDSFEWSTPELTFSFALSDQRLRQKQLLPAGTSHADTPAHVASGVETAIQCTGEDSPDPGMKQGVGQPGARLLFKTKQENVTANGRRLILSHFDPQLQIAVDSFYDSFSGVPVVRRWTKVTNQGTRPVGIDFISSAMLHSLADGQNFERELVVHLAYNSWMAEAQWHSLRPSELGFVENERTSWSQASAGSIGSWSTEKYLPMAMVENKRLGITWFWQIEHNGSWYWEVSNFTSRGNRADDVYAWLGGPDDLHSAAWKNLQPGASYESVPVAIGCVNGPGGSNRCTHPLPQAGVSARTPGKQALRGHLQRLYELPVGRSDRGQRAAHDRCGSEGRMRVFRHRRRLVRHSQRGLEPNPRRMGAFSGALAARSQLCIRQSQGAGNDPRFVARA